MITGAVTAQAYQLQRHLNTTDLIIFADSVDLPQLSNRRAVKIPPGDSSSFAHLLLTICLDLEIETVYPLRKAEVSALSEARQLFDEYGIKVIVPDKASVDGLFSKGFKGEIVVNDGATPNGLPDTGIFLVDNSTKEFQIFTVD